MFADDLIGSIALEALGTRVPAAYPPFQVEHVDRVIGDALDEQTEALLPATKFFLRRPSLGQVARDLCKTH